MKIFILIMLVIAIATMAHLGGPLGMERKPKNVQRRRDGQNVAAA